MNKTVNINLGGMFFHIDEDAYVKLTRYFEAIRRSLSNAGGQDEIIKDIEMRIAELVSEMHTSDKQVISASEVEQIIAIMGQPEDYRLEDDEPETRNGSRKQRPVKKLYRDVEKGSIAGVATGLSHYIGIDAIWVKLIFGIVLIAGFGTGLLIYLLLWLLMPAAVTTAEKLEMRGEPVNISNIERKVREEFDAVSQKIANADYAQMGDRVAQAGTKFGNITANLFTRIFEAIARALGALIVLFSAVVLGGLIIGFATLIIAAFTQAAWHPEFEAVNYTDVPLWIIGLLGLFVFGIPMLALFLLGWRLLVPGLRSTNRVFKYAMTGLWIISLIVLIVMGVQQATAVGVEGKAIQKQELSLKASDTLKVQFAFNDFYAQHIDNHTGMKFVRNPQDSDVIYSNSVRLEILPTNEPLAYLQVIKLADGRTMEQARARAEKVDYAFSVNGNQLELNNYFTTDVKNGYRNQRVVVYLYVPGGLVIQPDASIEKYHFSGNAMFDVQYSGNYSYKVEANKLTCLDCPEWNAAAPVAVPDSIPVPPVPPAPATGPTSLRMDENGHIIKTQ